jgi:hypothetical protein
LFASRVRNIAVIAGFALAALPAVASAQPSRTFSYFAPGSGSTGQFFLPNGNPFGADTESFMAGDTAQFANVLYTGVRGSHSPAPTGHALLNCTFISADRAICNGYVEVDKSKFEANNVPVSFTGEDLIVPVNGGTGKFAGACGYVDTHNEGAQLGDTQFTVVISSYDCKSVLPS